MLKTAFRWLVAVPIAFALSAGAATPAHGQTSCPNGAYTNTSGNRVCSPFPSSQVPAGATALCRDNTWSMSQHRSGTCSSHGGVSFFLADVAPAAVAPTATTSQPATGTVTPTPAVAAIATPRTNLAGTGLRHAPQFIELALVFLGLGAALVFEVRARDALERFRRR
jgi:hypothetical protein